jgi:Mn-dependent DtxR family transcriptional regulator
MGTNRVRIDVRNTDRSVFQTIQQLQAKRPNSRIATSEIAAIVPCHQNTAKTAIRRLRSAGYLAYESERGRACLFHILRTE